MKRNKSGQFVKLSRAEKIRRLSAKGLSRVEIAEQLGVRYQTVRNALAKAPVATA